jgi:hypothetical protein
MRERGKEGRAARKEQIMRARATAAAAAVAPQALWAKAKTRPQYTHRAMDPESSLGSFSLFATETSSSSLNRFRLYSLRVDFAVQTKVVHPLWTCGEDRAKVLCFQVSSVYQHLIPPLSFDDMLE